jgi:uncharacterized protein (DUF885 family)
LRRSAYGVFAAVLVGCDAAPPLAPDAGAAVTAIADNYYALVLERAPEVAYLAAIDSARHDGLFDNRPAAYVAHRQAEDRLQARLSAIRLDDLAGTPEWVTAVMLAEALDSAIALRVCRIELWNVNHIAGWHLEYARIAELQPVGTAGEREQALARWARFSAFIDQEQANLASGLAAGYSAPRPVVDRVLKQLDGILGQASTDIPFASPGARSDDRAFRAAFDEIVANGIVPALTRYRDYLAATYRNAAREALSVTVNPEGADCYAASLESYTTLDATGQEIFAQGQAVVAANRRTVAGLGREMYGTTDFAGAVAAALADPADRFGDGDELLAFSRAAVKRAEAAMPGWVGTMPEQAVAVVAFPAHEEGTGRSAHYRPGNADRPAEYRIPLNEPAARSRGNTEVTAFHETWPGHHLQVATAQGMPALHPVTTLLWFSGPGEGWARYAEALAEEMQLYETATGPLLRRAWPAHGMVVDPGIHLYGWSRERAVAFMLETGRFPPEQGDSMVDRIAILPGQLTAYDAGGLEILALRREAEIALGEEFDLRQFHDRVLEHGTIPLGALRHHIENWIAAERERP